MTLFQTFTPVYWTISKRVLRWWILVQSLSVNTLVFTCAYWFVAVYPQGTHACNAQSETAA